MGNGYPLFFFSFQCLRTGRSRRPTSHPAKGSRDRQEARQSPRLPSCLPSRAKATCGPGPTDRSPLARRNNVNRRVSKANEGRARRSGELQLRQPARCANVGLVCVRGHDLAGGHDLSVLGIEPGRHADVDSAHLILEVGPDAAHLHGEGGI